MKTIGLVVGSINGIVALYFQLKKQYDKAAFYMIIAMGILLSVQNH